VNKNLSDVTAQAHWYVILAFYWPTRIVSPLILPAYICVPFPRSSPASSHLMQSGLLRNPLWRWIDQRHQPLFIVLRASSSSHY